ncbi:MAG: kynureninase [Parachlamydiaceae bacterium]|nr:kynureninase [Parachlamydiaceae bacterium]
MNDFLKKYEEKALQLDSQDPLKKYRSQFALPEDSNTIYLCNNSLGLPAITAFTQMQEYMQQWKEVGVEGWFQGKTNWYNSTDTLIKEPLSHLLGANVDEVAAMNSLTVNLHLLLVSFYQPSDVRFKILIEGPTFPSDLYAIKSHLMQHGLDPEKALIILEPRNNEHLLAEEDIKQVLVAEGDSIALIFLSSVNFLTGQVLDMESITKLAKEKGCIVGYDIAHATGNIPLQLHKWGVDFAVGCSYKYLCSGPGGPGIAYVHESHHYKQLPRLSGWWGNDPKTRFQMQLQQEFIPYGGASSWQVSTPSILAMAPLIASLAIYEEAGINELRKKSEIQTAFLLELLEIVPTCFFEIITPRNQKQRGAQLSLLIRNNSEECLRLLENKGVICDFRPPNIIRVTPSPLYNTFHEIYRFVCRFSEALKE